MTIVLALDLEEPSTPQFAGVESFFLYALTLKTLTLKITMQDRTHLVKQNPLYSVLLLAKVTRLESHQGLERTYYLGKSNKVLKTLKATPSMNADLTKLDHNRVLDLYPECEYIFGPYVDANAQEFNQVYLLYTNRINQPNEVKVLYAARILQEHDSGVILDYHEGLRDEVLYVRSMASRTPLKGKVSNHCYYRPHRWSAQEVQMIKEVYGATSCSQPCFNTLRECYNCNIIISPGERVGSNVYRVLYEIYHAKKRLSASQVVYSLNGRKADIRPDNVGMRDVEEEGRLKRQEALEKYGLDVPALEKIFAKIGFNRFRGIYTYEGEFMTNGLKGRKYVKLVKDGTDEQYTLLLSRGLMTVHMGRLLTEEETVDHIDHNSQNDTLSNLRILPRSAHTSEDAIRIEIDPLECGVCGKHFHPSAKTFSYYKLNPYIPTCTPKCSDKLRQIPDEEKAVKLAQKRLTFRYYVLDKDTRQPKYFAEGMSYKECRDQIFGNGKNTEDLV